MPTDLAMPTLVVAVAVFVGMMVVGLFERRRHAANLAALDLRICVNGSRGKSTVTRMLTGALGEGGLRTMGKTTGTEARMIMAWSGAEIEVHRRPEGANIGEQRAVMARAAREGAEAVVSECMAVQPDYQLVFNRDLVGTNIMVITNALDDHLDEMGPTSRDVAQVFGDSFPRGGVVVVTPGRHLGVFRRAADAVGATLLVADPDEVTDRFVRAFDYLVFPDHIALTLAVTRHLGIPDEAAARGMLHAPSDPFATRLLPIGDADRPALFVNAFPANDPESTIGVWDHVVAQGFPSEGLVVVMNCREDRPGRTQLFVRDVLPRLDMEVLVITGTGTDHVVSAAAAGALPAREVHDLTGRGDDILDVLPQPLTDRVVLGVGNLHAGGTDVIDAFRSIALPGATGGMPRPPVAARVASGDQFHPSGDARTATELVARGVRSVRRGRGSRRRTPPVDAASGGQR